MSITRKTVFVLDNNEAYDSLEAALGNLRLLKYQRLFISLFPEQSQMVGAWAKVFSDRNAEILTAFQRIETELAEAAAELGAKP